MQNPFEIVIRNIYFKSFKIRLHKMIYKSQYYFVKSKEKTLNIFNNITWYLKTTHK